MSDRASNDLLPATQEPVRVAVRRMRWFRAAFHRYLSHLSTEIGCSYEVDDAKLAGVFVHWLRAVEAQKPADPSARRSYFEFAAGLMLRELIRDMPVRAKVTPSCVSPQSAAAFWPEGYACTMFCLMVTAEALRQEFDEATTLAPEINDVRHWWSFRENAAKDPVFSISFLDMMMGHEPNWLTPGLFSERLRQEVAGPMIIGSLSG